MFCLSLQWLKSRLHKFNNKKILNHSLFNSQSKEQCIKKNCSWHKFNEHETTKNQTSLKSLCLQELISTWHSAIACTKANRSKNTHPRPNTHGYLFFLLFWCWFYFGLFLLLLSIFLLFLFIVIIWVRDVRHCVFVSFGFCVFLLRWSFSLCALLVCITTAFWSPCKNQHSNSLTANICNHTRQFSNWCDINKVVKVVHGNQSDNHCNQPGTQLSVLLPELY